MPDLDTTFMSKSRSPSPVDRDPVCGYVGVIGEVCPRCGRREGEALSKERIDELRKKYPEITTFCGCE